MPTRDAYIEISHRLWRHPVLAPLGACAMGIYLTAAHLTARSPFMSEADLRAALAPDAEVPAALDALLAVRLLVRHEGGFHVRPLSSAVRFPCRRRPSGVYAVRATRSGAAS